MRALHIKSDGNTPLTPGPQPVGLAGENDLLGLITILWCAKLRILANVLIFIAAGGLLSFLLPQRWTSYAIITAPEETQWFQLREQLVPLEVLGVNGALSRNEVLNLFLKKFRSRQELETFITTSATLMTNFNDKNVGPLELQRFITAISEKMKAVNDNATNKEGSQPYSAWTLSFTGSTSVEAQFILNSYIKYIAAQVVSQLREDLRERIALKVHTEKEALELERVALTTMRNIRIQRLSYSLQIAKATGVIRPLYSHGQAVKDDPDFSIVLGADGIARKLAIEQSMTDVSELNDVFRNRVYQLSMLENMTLKEVSLPVFKYQQSASLPLKKDGPGAPVAILVAALLGVLYSCGNVLLRHELVIRRAVTEKGYSVNGHGQ